MKTRRTLVIAAVVLVAAIVVIAVVLRGEPKSITLTGIVTTNDIRVGSMLQGRIEKLAVAPGDHVKKGEVLARIRASDQQAALDYYQSLQAAAKAAVTEANAQLQFSTEQTTQQIRQAQADLAAANADAAQAEANLDNAASEYKRQRKLGEQKLSSVQAIDAARTTWESAKAHALSASRHAEAATAAVALAKANKTRLATYQAEVAAAHKKLSAARAETAKAEVQLDYTDIHAPIAGIVDVRAALTGEVVNPGDTIVTLINPDDLWIRADVEESYIGLIHLGDKLKVRLPSGATRTCPVFFRGIDAAYATQRDVSRTKRDIKTFEIRLRCDNQDRSLALGMTAYVTLPLHRT